MRYLDIEKSVLDGLGALYTAKEIAGQPDLWMAIYEKAVSRNSEISEFLSHSVNETKRIILTGAGTSGFIGYSLEGVFSRKMGIATISVATTHLVSHPKDYFDSEEDILLVSFARSGNSPESVAAIELADKYCDNCRHLIITCNSEGSLAKHSFQKNSFVFILPPEADDKSLAMTGSYSGMLLAALLIIDIDNIQSLRKTVASLKNYGQVILNYKLDLIKKVATSSFDRAVFLGSGPQYGTAMESHLKLQELTDGQVICKFDSYLGFRHGPKAVVNEDTLIVYYFSNAVDVLKYEKDLVAGMLKGKKPLLQIGISEKKISEIEIDELIVLSEGDFSVDESFLSVTNILLGQLIGFYKSLDKNLSPDSPSVSGAISRVVKGVTIY